MEKESRKGNMMKLPDKIYDVLQWLALVALDALGKFYQTIAKIWSLPYGQEVFETAVALSILVGALIGISKVQWKKENDIVIIPKEQKDADSE